MAKSRAVLRPVLGFGMVLALVAAIAVLANSVVRRIAKAEALISGPVTDEVVSVEQLVMSMESRNSASVALTFTGRPLFREQIGTMRTEFNEALDNLRRLVRDPERVALLDRIESLDRRFRAQSTIAHDLAARNQLNAAREHYVRAVAPLRVELVSELGRLRSLTRARAEAAHEDFNTQFSRQTTLLTVFTGAALTFAALIAFLSAYNASRSERDLADAARRAEANEKTLFALLSASPDLIFLVDHEQRIRFASLSSLRSTGQTAEALQGTPLADLELLDETRARFRVALVKVLSEGVTERLEGWCRTLTGREYLEFIVSPIYEEGRIDAAVVTGRNLTDRLQIEAELRRSNRQIGSILESITDAFVSLDRDWRFTYVNREAERLFRLPRRELEGRTMWEAFPDTLGSPVERAYRDAMDRQEPVHLEERFAPIGRWLEIHAYPSELGLSVYFRDISDRKRVELQGKMLAEASAQLAESLDFEAVLDRVVETPVPFLADASALWIRQDGELRFVARDRDPDRERALYALNEAFPRDLTAPAGLGSLFRGGAPTLIRRIDTGALTRIADSMEEFRAIRRLGFTSLLAVPIRGRQGIFGTLVLACRDRTLDETDLVVAEQLAERASFAFDNAMLYQEAQAAVRTREGLLAVVSHDLRNPLNHIQLVARLLLQSRGEEMDDKLRRRIESIGRSADRMRALILDLVDLASAQAKRLSMTRSAWPVSRLLGDAREAFEPLFAEKRLRLVVEDRARALQVDCDRQRFIQVLSNIVGNAIRFSPVGGRITLGAEPTEDGRSVRFCVSDEGPGIPPEHLSRLFDRFWTTGGDGKVGTGLGLYIVKTIVESHGGRVWAESEPGQGARFYFELPLARPAGSGVEVVPTGPH